MSVTKRVLQYLGVFAQNPPNLILAERAPTTSDKAYLIGTLWLDQTGDDYYGLVDVTAGSATWNVLATTPGNVDTLTGGSGGAITPTAGNITLAGTASQITTTGSGHTITWSLPSAITAPGSLTTTTSLASTTTMTAGTGLTVTTGGVTVSAGGAAVTGTTTINNSGAAVTTIGTGGTGAVNIGNATGNTAVTGSLTASTGLVATTGGMTASAGDITATAGNVIINGAAKQLRVHGGAVTDFIGQATLANGTVTVSNTNIATADKIFVQRHGINSSTALGVFNVAISNATSFTITALKPADATTETGDTSIVDYFIVRQV